MARAPQPETTTATGPGPEGLTDALARRAAERAIGDRQADYAREMRRIIEATYGLIERSGDLRPSLRDVLAETGLSTQAFYRYFRSKDELFLVLLDDGRQRLVAYLSHRMARAADPAARVGAWIRGVLAQARDPHVAARTRPFTAEEDRIAELFPAEHAASVERLADLLATPLAELTGTAPDGGRVRSTAQLVYDLSFATLRRHLAAGTSPPAGEADHLVGFVLAGVTAGSEVPRSAAGRTRGGRGR